jgi:hypothetical protein
MSLTDLARALTIRPVLKRLDALTAQIKRLADAYEESLAQQGLHMHPPKADTSGDEPEALYTDEEMDAARDLVEQWKQEGRPC